MSFFLEFRNITKRFPGVLALDNICMKIRKGEIHALLGENGAGKSTLMKILAGVYAKDSGEILLDGKVVEIANPGRARELGISVIYQEVSLIRELNIQENLFLGKFITKKSGFIDWKMMSQKTSELLSKLKLDLDPRTPVEELSIAQCQMVEIARALLDDAKIIVLDEPTSSLEENEKLRLFEIIDELKEHGVTMIYISHKLDEIVSIADSATVIKDGTNVSYLEDRSEIVKDRIIHDMVGRELGDYYPEHANNRGEKILSVRNLSQGNMVRDVSFDVYRGEILGFSGLIGAGRSETMMAIFGASGDVKGEIVFQGEEVHFKKPLEAIRKGIAYAPENRKEQGLILEANIADNVILANFETVKNRLGMISGKVKRNIVDNYIKRLRIATFSQFKNVVELSGGNQQKVIFAKWLNSNAELYIFDEPTRGIDVGSKAEIYKLMRELTEQNKAVIVISSELPEIVGLCDRVLVMRDGRISGELQQEELSEERIMYYAFGQS